MKIRVGFAVLYLGLALTACGGGSGGSDDSDAGTGTGTGGGGGGGGQANTFAGTIKILSNRSDLISGDDALVEVTLPPGIQASDLTMTLNGANVTQVFAQRTDGRYLGLLTGLIEKGVASDGVNVLTVRAADGSSASTTIVNHPNGGPVFSGPQLMPWTCRNSAALDAFCNQPAEYSFLYKSSDSNKQGFQPYDPAQPASDVAQVTTEQGQTLPFIVRVETGYQDRDQYRIAVLYQPDQPWTTIAPQPQFNHKLLVNHGFGCGVEYQNASAPTVVPGTGTAIPVVGGELPVGLPIPLQILVDATETALGKGFAVMSTALDNASHNCNVAVQAESLVMAKERVIEQYGELRYTIGQGCSGGSLAQQWIANAYPGIYQGILPTCSFPDAWSTATQFADYHLLLAYFQDPSKWGSGVVWLPTQMADVQGHLTIVNSIVSDAAQWSVAVPTSACGGISAEQRYHPQNNPDGVRCSITDAAINIFGPRPQAIWSAVEQGLGRGFAGFPIDNVGVQYGLRALQAGTITATQFLDLNIKIGGLDVDTNPIPERTPAVQPALANAYRSGMINVTNNMDRTAIIDCRGPDPGAFHDSYRAFAVRARLDREHGNHDNQLIWEGPILILGDNDCAKNSFVAMDRWLLAVEQDISPTPLPQKLVANKPADLMDACFDGLGHKLTDGLCPKVTVPGSPALSVGVVPVYGTPRMMAGDAITTDTNKCQLKPLNRNDNYGLIPFTDAQWAQMQTLFPDGVCDFSLPGVSKQGTVPWQTYQNNAGGVIYGGMAMPAVPANSGGGWASPAFFNAP
jgi:hypothetical protein